MMILALEFSSSRRSVALACDGTLLAEAVAKNVSGAKAFATFEEAEKALENAHLGEGDVLVTMGAGQAYKVGDRLLD